MRRRSIGNGTDALRGERLHETEADCSPLMTRTDNTGHTGDNIFERSDIHRLKKQGAFSQTYKYLVPCVLRHNSETAWKPTLGMKLYIAGSSGHG